MTNDRGYVRSSEPTTLRQALTSLMSFYIYQSTIGDEKEREILVYVYMVYAQFWCLVVVIFQYRFNVKNAGAICSSQFYVHIYVKIIIHAFMQPCLFGVGFLGGGEKKDELIFF